MTVQSQFPLFPQGLTPNGVQIAPNNFQWVWENTANPTTRLDGSALVAGDMITVPISTAKSGRWEWTGLYWVSATPYQASFSQFTQVNVTFQQLIVPMDIQYPQFLFETVFFGWAPLGTVNNLSNNYTFNGPGVSGFNTGLDTWVPGVRQFKSFVSNTVVNLSAVGAPGVFIGLGVFGSPSGIDRLSIATQYRLVR